MGMVPASFAWFYFENMDMRKKVLCVLAERWPDMCKLGYLGIQRTVFHFRSPPGE